MEYIDINGHTRETLCRVAELVATGRPAGV